MSASQMICIAITVSNITGLFFLATTTWSQMSIVSLNDETELRGLPKEKVILDPQLQRTAEQLDEIDVSSKQLCQDCNDANDNIERNLKSKEKKLEFVQHIQNSSAKYWKLVGVTTTILLGIKAVEGGMAILSWLRRLRQNNIKPTETNRSKENNGSRNIVNLHLRLHARAWNRRS
jgi:hypothetical protein